MFYDLFIILDGKEFKVELMEPATEEEAIDFIKTMRNTNGVDCISTTQGILSFKNSDITSVYYLAKPIPE